MQNSDFKNWIHLHGVKQNNLKNISVRIPKNQITVITGLSGSGKSTLAFETLYAEGQRRYVESLSTYTRQFLEKMPKPELDKIENIPPAVALEQRNTTLNSRSTVGTQSEIFDFLRLLFSKVGTLSCEVCHHPVKDQTFTELTQRCLERGIGKKFAILAPIHLTKVEEETQGKKKPKALDLDWVFSYFQILNEQGFRKVYWKKEKTWLDLSEQPPKGLTREELSNGEIFILIDRMNWVGVEKPDSDQRSRFSDSLEQASRFGHETFYFLNLETEELKKFQTGFSCFECGKNYLRPSPNLFSFQSPLGACPTCNGFGYNLTLDRKKIIPDERVALNRGAIDPISKPSHQDENERLLRKWAKDGIRPGTIYQDLSDAQKKIIWDDVLEFFKDLESYKYKFHVRIFIRRYQAQTECTSCKGSRLKPEALRILVQKKNIADLLSLPMNDLKQWFESAKFNAAEKALLKEVLPQLLKRLDFLCRVGVPYLTLNRLTRTLSGGEFQRVNLATHLGNGLSGTLYVLDEPTIGLHPTDTQQLLDILKELKSQGNTVVLVEHEPEVLREADWIIELGPYAGNQGGALVQMNAPDALDENTGRTQGILKSLQTKSPLPKKPRPKTARGIEMYGCSEHSLKNIDVSIPLERLVVVTGVSGSGKTTLIHHTLAKALEAYLAQKGEYGESDESQSDSNEEDSASNIGAHKKIQGFDQIDRLILLDQKPIGKSSRSNPATYMKVWDEFRKLYAAHPTSVARGYGPGYFSFNVEGGRCSTCKGEGEIAIDMHFMAEIRLKCEDCNGRRFMKNILDIRLKGKSVADLLETPIDEAFELFKEHTVVRRKLNHLKDVGLGYIALGQPAPSLSGGESQRLKIAHALDQDENQNSKDLYLLDEPSTGLHQEDVEKLNIVLQKLVDQKKSVLLIEHHLDLIANADWVIDLGPEGGEKGGEIVAEGTPIELMKHPKSKTGAALSLRFQM